MRIAGSAVVLLGISAAAIGAPAVRFVVSNDLCVAVGFGCVADHQPPPLVATSGKPFALVLVAVAGNGVNDQNYSGTAHFSSSDPQATLPGNYTFVPNDEGGKVFSATLITPGDQAITVTDAIGHLTGTLTLHVTASEVGIPTLTSAGTALLAVALATLAVLFLRRGA